MELFSKEIVHLQIGNCGNQFGLRYWEFINDEEGIDNTGIKDNLISNLQESKKNVYYNESSNGKYSPRAIIIDTKLETMESFKKSSLNQLFKPNSFVFGQCGAGFNWADGYYEKGKELIDSIMEAIRKEVELCDGLQGFQICHSIGGGTGGGLTSLTLTQLRDEYPDCNICTFTLLPSPKSNTLVEPYNSILSFPYLIDYVDEVFVLDNEILWEMAIRSLKNYNPTYNDLNNIISYAMSGMTCSLRFPGLLNSDLRKLYSNLVISPNLHFLTCGYSPISSNINHSFNSQPVTELYSQAFNRLNTMIACETNNKKYLRSFAMFRGKFLTKEVDELLKDTKYSICNIYQKNIGNSLTFIGNSTSIVEPITRLNNSFNLLWNRKAFVHCFIEKGMDELEFLESEISTVDLISEYTNYNQ